MITSANFTISELKQMVIELLINKTDKLSDISDDSVLNGVAFGVAKVAQKAIKDIAIVESKIFPQTSKGSYLDESAALFGVSPRRGALGSSTYIKVIAPEGTTYTSGVNVFKSNNGIQFEIEETVVVGSDGYDYVKVRSIDSGVKTNSEPNSIITVTPSPSGHKRCTNEYMATGGVDAETDEVFRIRIVNYKNIFSLSTLGYYTQIFQNLDDRILKVFNLGINEDGKHALAVVNQNGAGLTSQELINLLEQIKQYLPISDLNQFGNVMGVVIQNIEWYEVSLDFRLELDPIYNPDDVRKNIQINLSKMLDFRFWKAGDKVEWDNLLDVVKKTEGVKYVSDLYFLPHEDEFVSNNKLPRIKVFIMRDLDGNIIYDNAGVLSPVFYPSE